ncbi:MAG: AAA domain-containing protein [Lachnospiraceae bacterium]|nr:AAA domain-containing protein [Lachnospiraceae bacterium]
MTMKTEQLLLELTRALFEKKAVLLTGNTGVGKTYLAKKIAEQLSKKEYSHFPANSEQSVKIEIISCHNSVTYEDVVGGIISSTDSGRMVFEYKDKILIETLIAASKAYNSGKGTKYVLIFDDLQRSDVSSLFGDAVSAIGAETEVRKIYRNSGVEIDVTPNFYIIGTYNATETDVVPIANEILRKFYIKEILSDIEYITEDNGSENAIFYNQVRSLIMNYLDMQYRLNTYEQNRYLLGHGYFCGNDVTLKIKYQLVPVLKQYIAEGILDAAAEESVRLLEVACNNKRKEAKKLPEENCFSEYRKGVSAKKFLLEDSTSVPLENLIGRIIDQRLLSNDDIKKNLLFNTCVCYREKEVGEVTWQAQLLATNQQYEKIRRGGGDGRKLYNGGTLKINGIEFHFTGGMQPKEYTVRNPKRKTEIWNIVDRYEIGESTSPNVILYRITWQYYKTLINNLELYLTFKPEDTQRTKLLKFIKDEWKEFLDTFKAIRPTANSDANKKAENNKEANRKVRELIGNLKIIWSNLGDKLTMPDGTEIILEGVDSDMNESVYQEYKNAMEMLGIKQMILQGPPGTSKTYSAKAFLRYMAHNCTDTELADIQIADYTQEDKYCAKLFKGKGEPEIAWDIVQFHPSYGYEDFIRGIKVSTEPGTDTILYETVNKVLGSIAELAKKHPKTKFFLIIDEINRANLATVFGELIYGLEYRTESVATPYAVNNNNRISLPDNLYVIGTMNTADKSIGGIDYAIRRRFLFFEQLPDENVIRTYKASSGIAQNTLNEKACKLFAQVKKIFGEDYLSPEYRREDVQIGHTYFLVDSEDKLMRRFEYQIIPILKEYYKDGIISFSVGDSIEGFTGFLNCIAGRINMTTQKEELRRIFRDLIA